MEVNGQFHVPAALPPWERATAYKLDGEERKIHHCHRQKSNPGRPARRPIKRWVYIKL